MSSIIRPPLETTTSYYVGESIWYILLLIESALLLRFILQTFTTGSSVSSFTALLYSSTDWLVAPFTRVTSTSTAGGGLLEWSTLLAMIAYWFVVFVIVQILMLGLGRRRTVQPKNIHAADNQIDEI